MRFCALLACAAAACGGDPKKEIEPPSEQSESPEPAQPLWSFAPSGWMGAAVVADGSIEGIDAAADEIRRIAEAVGSGTLLDQGRSFLLIEGVDVLDPSSLSNIGIDTSKGLAVFVTPALGIAMALSVSDRDTLRTELGGVSRDGFDDYAGTLCKPARGRYLCASNRELWDQVSQTPAEVPVRKSPDPDVVLAATSPDGGDLLATFGGPRLGLRSARFELRLERGAATWRADLDMPPPRGWLPARRRRAPEAFLSVDETAFGFLRLRIPPDTLRQLPWPRKGPIDLADVLAPELTGDLSVVSSGRHPMGVHVVAGLNNGGPVQLALRTACRLASFAGYGRFSFENDQCQGRVDLRKLGAPPTLLSWLPSSLPTFVRITSSSAILSIMVPMQPGLAVGQAQGPVAQRIHDADWNFSAWGRWADPEAVLPPKRAALVRGELARLGMPREVAAVRALMALVYDAGVGVRASKDGLVLEGTLSTFFRDPTAVYAEYSAACIALGKGDVARYRRMVGDIARAHPDSLVASQAKVKSVPLAPLLGLGAVLSRFGLVQVQ